MKRYDRQSFLGADSEQILRSGTVGFVGLGGGGSHLVQQAAHLGIGGYVLVDPDHITETNTNRLIGGTLADLGPDEEQAAKKVKIAERVIRGLQPTARINPIPKTWHDATDHLLACDIIVGAVDTFKERDELERFARRNLIPYLDIGMNVGKVGAGHYLISGQAFLSMPGKPCLRCCGIVTEDNISEEANNYGAAGGKPQVVWSNGVLASTAIGIIVQLLTSWFPGPPEFVYLNYDGNTGTLVSDQRVALYKDRVCPHHPQDETGDALFDIRAFNAASDARAEERKRLALEQAKHRWRRLLRRLLLHIGL